MQPGAGIPEGRRLSAAANVVKSEIRNPKSERITNAVSWFVGGKFLCSRRTFEVRISDSSRISSFGIQIWACLRFARITANNLNIFSAP